MKMERQQDQDVAERLRRENLERTNAPKDNEVDEKAVAWLITYTERDGSKRQAVYTHNAIADWRMFDPAATSEPLYSAATVAELRAEVESSGLKGELAALEQFLRMASEPVGQECCGQGSYECCGNPIPVFAQPHEVFQAMSDRHAEILASLAALTGADPT